MKSQFGGILVNVVFFVSAVVIAFLFLSAMYNNVNNMIGASIARSSVESQKLQGYIQIVSCSYNNSQGTLSIYVTNFGTVPINQNMTSLFINGVLYNISNISIVRSVSGSQFWGPYDILLIQTRIPNISDFYRIRVVSGVGSVSENLAYVNVSSSTCILQ